MDSRHLADALLPPTTACRDALSATIDEGFHITSGYEYLRTGSLQLFDEHAPLAKALFAWPLFAVPDLQPPEETPGWEDGNLIQVTQATTLAYRPIDRVIVACRIPVALLTVILAATVYHWAAGLFGPTAALFALALFTFDPNLLGMGACDNRHGRHGLYLLGRSDLHALPQWPLLLAAGG